jgi:hypothetical protein
MRSLEAQPVIPGVSVLLIAGGALVLRAFVMHRRNRSATVSIAAELP